MPWRDGEVLADLERPPVDLRWNGPALDDVAEEILEAVQQASAVGLDRSLQRGGITQQEVSRRQRIADLRQQKCRAPGLLRLETGLAGVVFQGGIEGQITLQHRTVELVLFPDGIGKTLVAGLRRQIRCA